MQVHQHNAVGFPQTFLHYYLQYCILCYNCVWYENTRAGLDQFVHKSYEGYAFYDLPVDHLIDCEDNIIHSFCSSFVDLVVLV